MDSDALLTKWLESDMKKPVNAIQEIYLGNSGLRTVKTLARFTNLQRLWLNSNCLKTLKLSNHHYSFIRFNYRITELHLQKNELTSITGSLSHLHCLEVLLLHHNQISDLGAAAQELAGISTLKRLNFFGNPMALDEGYRLLIVYSLPSVKVLDREAVTTGERIAAQKANNPVYHRIQREIGFMSHIPRHRQQQATSSSSSIRAVTTKRHPTEPHIQHQQIVEEQKVSSEQRQAGDSPALLPPPQIVSYEFDFVGHVTWFLQSPHSSVVFALCLTLLTLNCIYLWVEELLASDVLPVNFV